MIDLNDFKRRVKLWIDENPTENEAELAKYCETLIPKSKHGENAWLIEQTIGGFRHLKNKNQGQ